MSEKPATFSPCGGENPHQHKILAGKARHKIGDWREKAATKVRSGGKNPPLLKSEIEKRNGGVEL